MSDTLLRQQILSPLPLDVSRSHLWQPAPLPECYCGSPVEGRNYPYNDKCRACRLKGEQSQDGSLVDLLYIKHGQDVAWSVLGWEDDTEQPAGL